MRAPLLVLLFVAAATIGCVAATKLPGSVHDADVKGADGTRPSFSEKGPANGKKKTDDGSVPTHPSLGASNGSKGSRNETERPPVLLFEDSPPPQVSSPSSGFFERWVSP
jgi:hypothetical protein